jgi:hypothetical protein
MIGFVSQSGCVLKNDFPPSSAMYSWLKWDDA